MKFEVEISKEDFIRLKGMLENQDCDIENMIDEDYINECFLLEDRHGNDLDIREDVTVKRIGEQ